MDKRIKCRTQNRRTQFMNKPVKGQGRRQDWNPKQRHIAKQTKAQDKEQAHTALTQRATCREEGFVTLLVINRSVM